MLRRGLIAAAVATFAMAVPASAGATHTLLDFQSAVEAVFAVDPTIQVASNDPGKDKAVGGFKGPDLFNQFGFSAHSGPMGEDARGQLTETDPQTFHGRWNVTCLAVAGKNAGLGLEPSGGDATNERVVGLFDGGPGGTGDMFGVADGVDADECMMGLLLAEFPILHGNILVHDAMP